MIRSYDGYEDENVEKAIGFILAKHQLFTSITLRLVHFFAVTA